MEKKPAKPASGPPDIPGVPQLDKIGDLSADNDYDKLSKLEETVWIHKKNYTTCITDLSKRKEIVADILFKHSKDYQKWARPHIGDMNKKETDILSLLYDNRENLRQNFRQWRLNYTDLILDTTKSDQLQGRINADPNFTKFLQGVAVSSNGSWNEIMIPYEAVIITSNSKLGEGGFGIVNRGIVYGTPVAIKQLKPTVVAHLKDYAKQKINESKNDNSTALSNQMYLLFKHEIEILKTLQHEHIIKFMGGVEKKELNYFAFLTEIAEYGSLADCLYNKRGYIQVKFSFSKKLKIMKEIAAGMKFLHGLEPRVLHLDLKPSNILLVEGYGVKIADFGLSQVEGKFGSIFGRTGTLAYMAPELLEDVNTIVPAELHKADVYSYGILINELLNEKFPYAKLPEKNLMIKQPVKPNVNRPKLYETPKLDIIEQCWETEPKKRPDFETILKDDGWEKVIIKSTSNDDLRDILSEFKNNATEITFTAFGRALSEILNEKEKLFFPNDDEEDTKNEESKDTGPYTQLLLAVLDLTSKVAPVKIDSVRRMLEWLKGIPKNEVLDTLYKLFTSLWFFGIRTDEEVVSDFSRDSKNKFMIRWSNEKSYFTLEKRLKKEKEIETIPLKQTIKELLASYPEIKTKGVDPNDYLRSRPVQLEGIALKEKFISGVAGTYHMDGKGGSKADLVGPATQFLSHYEFIL